MRNLSLDNTPAAKWTLKQFFRAAGLGQQLDSGRIGVADGGEVTIKTAGNKIAYRDTLETTTDLNKMVKTLGTAVPSSQDAPVLSSRSTMQGTFNAIRTARFEQRVNSRWFRDQDDWDSELKPQYRNGRRFDLPLVELPADRVQILSTSSSLPGMKAIEKFFDNGDTKLFPVHPQELKALAPKSSGKLENVRCASSDRTLHAGIEGAPDFLLKVPLNVIVHDGIIRPISVSEAQGSIAMTEFMMDWIDKREKPDDAFCFFPESMAITDTKTDSAAIIRMTTPYPPAKDGEKTWSVCAYSLYAEDKDFPNEPPMFQRLINNRPDKSVSEIDFFTDNVMGPLTRSVMRAALDLGAAHVPHGQNLFFEIGEDGQPSGRAPHADLESFWPLPELAKATGRKDFYKSAGYVYAKSKFEAKNWDTFRVYYLEGMLAPLLQGYINEHPEQAAEIMDRAEKQIQSEIKQRKTLVGKFNGAKQPLRMYDRLGNGQFKLQTALSPFFADEVNDLIAEQKKAPPTMSLLGVQAAQAKN